MTIAGVKDAKAIQSYRITQQIILEKHRKITYFSPISFLVVLSKLNPLYALYASVNNRMKEN